MRRTRRSFSLKWPIWMQGLSIAQTFYNVSVGDMAALADMAT
jgi:hypothetical protein